MSKTKLYSCNTYMSYERIVPSFQFPSLCHTVDVPMMTISSGQYWHFQFSPAVYIRNETKKRGGKGWGERDLYYKKF